MDGLALTDHGTMAGISHQQLHVKKLQAKGIAFKAIPGIEAYFVDSLSEWSKLRQVQKVNKQLKKTLASVGNEFAETESDMEEAHGKDDNEGEEGSTVIEIETEGRNKKHSDPITQRSHLVLLPKNNIGLKSLFQMVSESYIDGFYRYPRMDFDILKRHAKGNIVASSACVVGSAMLETNRGLLPLIEVVKLVGNGEDIFVLSYSEKESRLVFRKVLNGQCTKRKAKVVTITTAGGRTVRVTPDHKVLTDKGWLRADELMANGPVSILTSDT